MEKSNGPWQAYDPGIGYRLLSIGETIRVGDDVHFLNDDGWAVMEKTGYTVGHTITNPSDRDPCPFGFYRRKLDA